VDPGNAIAPVRTVYNSTYFHGVDEKRRVQIPAKWRPAQEDVEFTMFPWPSGTLGTCLRVLPPEETARLIRFVQGMDGVNTNKADVRRKLGKDSVQVTVDKAGRICIPQALAKEAGIEDQAVLVGLLDRFEIWSPEGFKRMNTAVDERTPDAFRMLE